MRKKRNVILAASLAAMLAVNSFSGVQFTQAKCYAAASQQSNETDANGFVIKDGVLTSYTGSATEITIPDTVTKISLGALRGNTTITKVTVPGTVKEIPSFCFYGCKKLQNVVLLDGVETIGTSVFSECGETTSVTIPASVTSISDNAFDLDNVINYSIFGDNGTTAETYAKDKGIAFNPSEVAVDAAQNNEAASKYVGIKNLKVSEIKNGAAQGKGDASIIYLGKNEYMLVDTGEKEAFGELKSGIEESCVAQADGRYHFKAIVVTHFHSDHCGGLRELVQWEKMHIENVYIKNYSNYLKSIKAVEKSKGKVTAAERRIQYAMAKPYNHYVKLVGGKTLDLDSTSGKEAIKVVKVGKKSNFKYDDITYPSLSELYANVKVNGKEVHKNKLTITKIGLKGKKNVKVGDTSVGIYGAPAQFKPKKYNDTNAENNASMIVRVVGKKQNSKGEDVKYKAIFMGDMTSDGIAKAKSAYSGIFTADFDYCKYGHHGLRAGADIKKIVKECKWYKQNINAKFYAFTLDRTRLNDSKSGIEGDNKGTPSKREIMKRNYKTIVYCLSHELKTDASAKDFANFMIKMSSLGITPSNSGVFKKLKTDNKKVTSASFASSDYTDSKSVRFAASGVSENAIDGIDENSNKPFIGKRITCGTWDGVACKY